MCCCCKLCTVGCAAEGIVMAGLNVGLGCGLGTETGVLPTGGCCFFLKESFINNKQKKWQKLIKFHYKKIYTIELKKKQKQKKYLVANWA